MYKKSLKKSNYKKNNKSFKKYLGGNNNINLKILTLKGILKENSDKIDEINDKLDNIIIENYSKEDKYNAGKLKKIISPIQIQIINLDTKIKTLEKNPHHSDKKVIDDLDKSIKDMDNINSKLNRIMKKLNKGFTYEVVKYIKDELNGIVSIFKFVSKRIVRGAVLSAVAIGIYNTSERVRNSYDKAAARAAARAAAHAAS
jgi:hypothetical protein